MALDIESNGFHRYPERICLVQIAVAGKIFLIDPLAIDDISPLGILLSDSRVVKIFHAADFDIRSLDRDWSFRIESLLDTSIAAAFCGHRKLGLATVLNDCLDIEIPKSRRLQRADWTLRPISADLLEYAAEDVRHLERLAMFLLEKLDDLGRTEWVREECERLTSVRFTPPDTKTAFLRVKGSRELDGSGLAILHSLHRFRQEEAVRRDRPPFKVFPDYVMISLAQDPELEFSKVRGIGRYAHGRDASRLRRALYHGVNASAIDRRSLANPKGRRTEGRDRIVARKRLRLLREWRLSMARSLGLDEGLVWPAASLERLSQCMARMEDEVKCSDVRRWQFVEFGDSLSDFTSKL